jgi:hypothetical protein
MALMHVSVLDLLLFLRIVSDAKTSVRCSETRLFGAVSSVQTVPSLLLRPGRRQSRFIRSYLRPKAQRLL